MCACAVLIIDRNLNLAKLARGRMYCTSFGDAAGDFHFVMEHRHAEALFRLHYPSASPPVFHGHGWMKAWMSAALDVPVGDAVANDLQLFGGMDEEVFRKTDFTQMLCNGFPYWKEVRSLVLGFPCLSTPFCLRAPRITLACACPRFSCVPRKFWAGYGMTDADWEDQRAMHKELSRGRGCPADRPLFAIHRMCCTLDWCTTRSASKGACCHRHAKHGLHHCLGGED